MVAFGHTAVGAGVGLITYNLIGDTNIPQGITYALTGGIISHYIADTIPHGHFFKHSEYRKKVLQVIIFDLLVSILLFTYLAYLSENSLLKASYIFIGIIGSQLPDVLDGLIYIKFLKVKGLVKLEHHLHNATHWHGKHEQALLLGTRDLWQLTVIIGVLIAILFY